VKSFIFTSLIIISAHIGCGSSSIMVSGGEDRRWKPRPDFPEQYEQGYRMYGSSPEQQIEKAKYLISIQNFEEALKVLTEVSNKAKRDVYTDQAHFMKGKIYSNIIYKNRDPNKAIKSFEAVIDNRPVTEFDEKAKQEIRNLKKYLQFQKK